MSRNVVIAMLLLMFAIDVVGQDYEFNIVQRRKYDQIHAEIWVKSLKPNPSVIGDASIWLEYNSAFLRPNTNTVNGIADSISSNIDQANPLIQINSSFNSTNGYASLSALNNQTNIGIRARLISMGSGGFIPLQTGRGSFLGKIVFDIINNPAINAQTGLKFLTSNPATNILDVNSTNITSKVSLKQPSNFTIIGVTLLSPKFNGQVIDRDKPYLSLANTYQGVGYPIYFERSISPQANPGTINGNIAYSIDYNDGSWKEIGRVADHNSQALGSSPLYRSGDIARPTGVGTLVITSSSGQAIGTSNFRNPLRVLWARPTNIRERSNNVRLRITMLGGSISDNIINRPKTNLVSESTQSQAMGLNFTSMLNGSNEYLRSEKTFSNPTHLTIEAWVNPTKLNSGDVGIVASSGGPNQAEIFGSKEGAWILYLKDGKFPAFRARENQNRGAGGYIVNLVAEDPILPSAYSDNDDGFSRNWTHIAAVLQNSVAYLYVNGELVATDIINKNNNYRLLITDHPIWVGVNPNDKLDAKNYFAGAIKEVKVWRTAFGQDSIRKYATGVVNPANIDVNQLPDTRTNLDLYYRLSDDLRDFASNTQFQNGENNLQHIIGTQISEAPKFSPDLPHGKITSPSRGTGLVLEQGQNYPIRFISFGLGNNATRFSRDLYLEFSTNNGSTWVQVENPQGLKLGGNGAIDVEDNRATWEPYQSNDVGGSLREVEPYEKKVILRITGHENHNQRTISNTTDEFIVSRSFSLRKTKSNKIYSDSTRKLLPNNDGIFVETWIKPHRFPTANERIFPILSMLDSTTNNVKYDLSLNSFGLLEFTYTNSNNQIKRAISDENKGLLEPISKTNDTAWVHIALYFNPYNQTSPFLLWIDGREINNQFNESQFHDLNYDSINSSRLYLGYTPIIQGGKTSNGFEGEFRELRFWRGFPAKRNYSNGKVTEFIQGALTVRADRFTRLDTLNLINSFSFNGGLFHKFGRTKTIAGSIDSSMVFEFIGFNPVYRANRPYMRIVEPPQFTEIKQNNTNVKIRWVGFGLDNNGFTSGQRFGNPPSLEFSEKGGAGNSSVPYKFVGSNYFAGNTRNSFTLPDSNNYRFKEFGNNIIFAASLDASIANSDMNNDNIHIDQGALPIVRENLRFRLTSRYVVESTPFQVRSESPLYTVIPGENFTLRVLLEGKHRGRTAPIEQIKTKYEEGGIRVTLIEDDNGKPGMKISTSTAESGYEEISSFHQNSGQRNFANLPFLFPDVNDGNYWVLVEQINHLPILSRYPAPFKYEGENKTTWAIESGWDFTSWNGVSENYLIQGQNTWTQFSYSAFGKAESNIDSADWISTGLNFNDGLLISSENSFPAMVAGDVNQDGRIDTNDIQDILLNTGGSNIQFDLNADSIVNAVDRILVLRNIGKVSSLGEFNYLVYGNSDTFTNGISKNNSENDNQLNQISTSKFKKEHIFLNNIAYEITSSTTVQDSIATVEFFIKSNGTDFFLGNSSFAFVFDTLKLDFLNYDNTGILFSNRQDAGYLNSFSAPNENTKSPRNNIRSIEIVLDKDSHGSKVPNTQTSLGRINFKIKTDDAIVQFNWHNSTAIFDINGHNINPLGLRHNIEPVKQFNIQILSPTGANNYAMGEQIEIRWLNEGNPIRLEFFNGTNWIRVSDSIFTKEATSFSWRLPSSEINNARFRIVDAGLNIELTRTNEFRVERRFGQIVSPANNDRIYKGGEFVQIFFSVTGYEKVDIEYTDNGGDTWQVVRRGVDTKTGRFSWTFPRVNSNIFYFRLINGSDIIDISDRIRVLNGSLNINTPNSATKWNAGTTERIRWNSADVTNFTLQFSLDGGVNWLDISRNVNANARYFNWNVPSIITDNAMIRAIWSDDPDMLYDMSSPFAIDLSSSTEFYQNQEKIFKLVNFESINNSVKVYSPHNVNVNAKIYDVRGRLTTEIKTYFTLGNNVLYLNYNLTNGIYFLVIETDDGVFFEKFIKD